MRWWFRNGFGAVLCTKDRTAWVDQAFHHNAVQLYGSSSSQSGPCSFLLILDPHSGPRQDIVRNPKHKHLIHVEPPLQEDASARHACDKQVRFGARDPRVRRFRLLHAGFGFSPAEGSELDNATEAVAANLRSLARHNLLQSVQALLLRVDPLNPGNPAAEKCSFRLNLWSVLLLL